MRELYHGSSQVVDKPRWGVGKKYNDYGQGFYCTEHADMAREWAVGFESDGYVNSYVLHDAGLTVLNLDGPQLTTLHWLAVLLENRTFDVRSPLANAARTYLIERFSVDLGEADVVEGYRADDSYFAFAQDFISGTISYQQLCRAMRLGDLGRQVVLMSKEAFARLDFVSAEPVPCALWQPRREQRDKEARRRCFDAVRNAHRAGDLYITQILDEEMGPFDDRLR